MAVFDNLNYTYSQGVKPGMLEEWHRKELLRNMAPELVHLKDAQKVTLPEHTGSKYVTFRRFLPYAPITAPLVEGQTPAGQPITQTKFSAMVKPYGAHVEYTDELDMYHIDNMHQEVNRLLADQAALTIDTIARDGECAGLNVQYVGSNTERSTIAATDKLTYAEIKKAVRTLKRKNCKPFADGFYHAIVHPDTVYDLTSDAMWVDVSKYQDKTKVEKYELGTIYKVKFYESTNAKVYTGDTYIYGTTTAITASANFDVTNKCLTTAATITADDARAMAGKMVYVQYTKGSPAVNYVFPMCIERVDPAAGKIYFKWVPASSITDEWTTAQSLKIVPEGRGNSVNVYGTLVYGQDAFGCVELGGNGANVEVILKPTGSSGALDPLNQRGTVGWKVKGFTTVILQDDFIVRIESGATA